MNITTCCFDNDDDMRTLVARSYRQMNPAQQRVIIKNRPADVLVRLCLRQFPLTIRDCILYWLRNAETRVESASLYGSQEVEATTDGLIISHSTIGGGLISDIAIHDPDACLTMALMRIGISMIRFDPPDANHKWHLPFFTGDYTPLPSDTEFRIIMDVHANTTLTLEYLVTFHRNHTQKEESEGVCPDGRFSLSHNPTRFVLLPTV